MSKKSMVWLCVGFFSIVGGYIPILFGSSLFSYSSMLGNTIGGLIGIWIGFKISDGLGL